MGNLFENYISRLLIEQDPAGIDPSAMGGAPTPSGDPMGGDPMGGAPMDDQPPPAPEKTFDKPYRELAKILYKAIETNFDELPEDLTNRLYSEFPDGERSIDTDEDGSKLFGVIEDMLNNTIDAPENVIPAEMR